MIHQKASVRRKDNYLVNWYEADLFGQAKLSSICNYLQESAWRHAEDLGYGYEAASSRNELWVIVGLMVRMLKYPEWGSTIQVETWPKGIDRLLAFRDYKISSEGGEVLGAATSSWMILDADTRRPKKMDIVLDKLDMTLSQDILNENPPHLSAIKTPLEGYAHTVRYSELDFNGHVNNTRYLDWCMDGFPADIHHSQRVETMVINFMSESKYGDLNRIVANSWEAGENHIHGIRENDGRTIFRARLHWKKI
jgi:medium-chain acyl-[acyl-carrier-protein] hydrolase